jgi:3-polyprenyl-4-hydroxybenzoate decarboxylase
VVGNPELGGRIQPKRLVAFSRTGWSDSPNSALEASVVIGADPYERADGRIVGEHE